MYRSILFVLAFLPLSACEDKCPPGAPCAAATSAHTDPAGEPLTPVALDPSRPQPPSPTAYDVSRSMERAPRGSN